MQIYPLLLAPGASRVIAATADLFVYESAETSPRTNLLGYSEQFEAAAWQKTSLSVTANAGLAPDGTMTADRITASANGWWMRQASLPVAQGVDYTGSVWMRGVVARRVELVLLDGGGVTTVPVDITTEWQRYRFSFRSADNVSMGSFQIGGTAMAGDVFVFGAMLERGSSMTPYIPSYGPGPQYGVGEARIKIQPDRGGEIILKPGQRFRAAEMVTNWTITNYGQGTIDGSVIIGAGEFDDANTKNTFKLDATFANSVSITNDVNTPVPVTVQNAQVKITNDAANRVPVTLDPAQTLQISGTNIMAYTTSSTSSGQTGPGNPPVQMVSPAVNVNGVILSQLIIPAGGSSTGTIYVLAKSSQPASLSDGDLLDMAIIAGSNSIYKFPQQIKIPPGRGVYVATDILHSVAKNALFTVL
jgi:hypothetical protein